MNFQTAAGLVLAPFLVLLVTVILRARRTQQAYLNDESPFAAKPYPPQRAPLAWLPRLSLWERLYLAERLKFATILPLVMLYIFFVAGAIPVFDQGGPNAHLWTNPHALAWLDFMLMPTNLMSSMNIVWIITAFLAVQPLRNGQFSLPWRTRPVSISFMFWTSILTVMIGELLAIACGTLLAFALFYKVHGAVWQHLPLTIPRILGPDDADVVQRYAALRASSAPYLLASLITTAALTMATFTTLALSPVNLLRHARVAAVLFLVPIVASTIIALNVALDNEAANGIGPLRRFFFVDNVLGPPPPLHFAVVPVALTLGLLFFANHLAHRCDA